MNGYADALVFVERQRMSQLKKPAFMNRFRVG